MNALSAGEYALAALMLLVIAASFAYASAIVRRLLAPDWTGAPAFLATTVVFAALSIAEGELLGTLGLLSPVPLVLAALTTAVGAELARRRRPSWAVGGMPAERFSESPSGGGASPPPLAAGIAALAAGATVALWLIPTLGALTTGALGTDTMWYHQPQAARFAQEASTWALHFTDPYFLNWFYPSNSELLHALGMVITERDFLSPLVNLAFLALGLLASWCVGRPYGLAPQTLIAGALAFSTQMIVDFQPGEARNDAIGLALVLAAIALLVNLWASRPQDGRAALGSPALLLPALAAGLAIGTKLNLLATVGVLTVGIIVLSAPGLRRRAAWIWLAGLAIGGGYWYVRNLIHAGTPLPWISSLGPLELPGPPDPIELRPQFAVSHYLTDFDVWTEWFIPNLGDALGPLWPALLGGAVAGAAGAIASSRAGLARVLGIVVGVSLIAYVFTPLTASGPEGMPEGFLWNLRYIAPALGAGLVLLALAPTRIHHPRAPLAASLLLAALTLVTVATADEWDLDAHRTDALAAGALTALAVFAFARRPPSGASTRDRRVGAPLGVVGVALAVGLALGGGYAIQREYMDGRYADVLDGNHLDEAIAWANDVSDARIATNGRGGIFYQYGFYGDDLSNHVQWVGEAGPAGSWLPIIDCAEWRAAVNAGGYDYVVTTYDQRFPRDDETSREREWLKRDPAADRLLADGPVAVFELTGELDPSGCGRREKRAARFGPGAISE